MNDHEPNFSLKRKGTAPWAGLDGCCPTALGLTSYYFEAFHKSVALLCGISKGTQCNITENKAADLRFILSNENGKSTHVPQSKSWHRSSRRSGPDENHWLHGSYSPKSFLTRPHLYSQGRKKQKRKNISANSILRGKKRGKEQRILMPTPAQQKKKPLESESESCKYPQVPSEPTPS